MLNLSPLFFTTVEDESCMHDELDLTSEQRAWIASARTDVRDCLRSGIPRVLRASGYTAVSYTHLRAHETSLHLVCRLLLEKNFFF